MDYQSFLASKRRVTQPKGFVVQLHEVSSALWLWQAYVVVWALKLGRAAIFADCGLGKTLMQLAWAEMVHRYTGKPVLILCPLVVGWQTRDEAKRFGISCPIDVIESMEDIGPDAGIVIANYEKLHLFDCSIFGGVVLDESSILKAFTGKTKQQLIYEFRNTPFKLCCTATPAPNDYLELGNHAEFLGVMPSNEMIARWFINDGKASGVYRLRKHGESDFWQWMASWAICISQPSDLGDQFAEFDFRLPDLIVQEHVIDTKLKEKGVLFNVGSKVSATNVHVEKRASLDERCQFVANLARSNNEAWALWCETDYEANAILDCLKTRGNGSDGIVEVRGSHSPTVKQDRLRAFTNGSARVVITKPEIGGLGLNWQHCHNTTCFASFKYEQWYQLIRRFLRYGQLSPVVNCHWVFSENEISVVKTMMEKEAAHKNMKTSMASCMKQFTRSNLYERPALRPYRPSAAVTAPSWLRSK